MKYLVSILALCLCSACATRKPEKPDHASPVVKTTVARKKLPNVRTPETVKAYPVGRYSDPNFPDTMHERHTVYRREQSRDWNYLPDELYALPMGPAVANSNPSPSYYVKTEREMMNAQQQAYAEALQEQNRVMKKRIAALQEEAGKVPELEEQIDGLKKQLDTPPSQPLPAAPGQPEPAETGEETDDFFSSGEISPRPVAAGDQLTAPLRAIGWQKIAVLLHAPFLCHKEFFPLTKPIP